MFCPTRTLNSNNKLSGRCAQKSQNKKGKSQQFGGSITTFLLTSQGSGSPLRGLQQFHEILRLSHQISSSSLFEANMLSYAMYIVYIFMYMYM